MGDIKVKFFEKEAPKAVENFVKLAEKDYYDGLIFHRVMAEFMLQGGDPTGTGMGGDSIYGKPFEDEFSPNLHNFRGALSMANSGANTNQSQFFIVQRKVTGDDVNQWMQRNKLDAGLQKLYQETGGTPWLDNKHTVFGQVFEGIEIVDKIAQVEVDSAAKPIEEVKILDIEILKY
jgi:peptidyl-prolyl cis-trans isomerase B (cyclophilin B)